MKISFSMYILSNIQLNYLNWISKLLNWHWYWSSSQCKIFYNNFIMNDGLTINFINSIFIIVCLWHTTVTYRRISWILIEYHRWVHSKNNWILILKYFGWIVQFVISIWMRINVNALSVHAAIRIDIKFIQMHFNKR